MLRDSLYSEALRVSKRYQITFSRVIGLGDISLEILCDQVPDSQLRQFVSNLKPQTVRSDLQFLLSFLSFVLNVSVTYDAAINVPPYDSEPPSVRKFATTICISFIVLEVPVFAVRLACQFESHEDIKSTVSFLLTLYDANELYDIAMKTYDTKCIASVGLVTMKEPSSYIPFVEELNRIDNPHRRNALIDEAVDDNEHAIGEYAQCGPEYEDTCVNIIVRECLFDVGLRSYPKESPVWFRICRLKLGSLATNKTEEIARTALQLGDPDQIVKFIKPIIAANLWRPAIRRLNREAVPAVRDALIGAKMFADAAYVEFHYLQNALAAVELFVQGHEWLKAIECGASEETVAEKAFQMFSNELTRGIGEAQKIKARFDDVERKLSEHLESTARRGRNKEKRGLSALIQKLNEMLPTPERQRTIEAIISLLRKVGNEKQAQTLKELFCGLCRAVWPIPRLPETETPPVPSHLQGILSAPPSLKRSHIL
jgi:elongator complex protein 1